MSYAKSRGIVIELTIDTRSYNLIDGTYAGASPFALGQALKGALNYQGFVVTGTPKHHFDSPVLIHRSYL